LRCRSNINGIEVKTELLRGVADSDGENELGLDWTQAPRTDAQAIISIARAGREELARASRLTQLRHAQRAAPRRRRRPSPFACARNEPRKSHNMPNDNVSNLARRYFGAYENKDRRFVEDLLSEGFTFSSPLDAHIDKKPILSAVGLTARRSAVSRSKSSSLQAARSSSVIDPSSSMVLRFVIPNSSVLKATSSPQLMSTSAERCARPGILSRQLRSRLL
jgi:hypothetical protein